MTPYFQRPLAADAFEALVENTIIRSDDLYNLDGETVFRRRGGTIETFGLEVAE